MTVEDPASAVASSANETVPLAAKPVVVRAPLLELSLGRLREFVREPGAIFWTFGFPILITIALGIAFRTQPPPKAAVVIVASPGAAHVAEVLNGTGAADARVLDANAAETELHAGKTSLVLLVPSEGGTVTYRYDPTRPEAKTVRLIVDDALQRAAGRADVRPVQEETVTAPGSRYVDWLIPGLLGMQLMSGSLWGMAWAIVQNRQRKLLKRLVATPMRRRDYLLSFMLTRFLFIAIEVPVLLGFAAVAFHVEIRGSIAAVGLVSLLGAAAFGGIGLLCASRAQNTETANGLVNLVSMPMFVLSGVFFSAARFPDFVQPFIRALPLTALNESLRAVINDGASLSSLPFQLGLLLAWTVIPFVIALRIFRWN